MRLLLYTDDEHYIWFLNTFCLPPDPKQLGLCLCRSLTLWADGLLVGPVDPKNHFLLLDSEGFQRAPGPLESAALSAFMRDVGILNGSVASSWHQAPADLSRLLSL